MMNPNRTELLILLDFIKHHSFSYNLSLEDKNINTLCLFSLSLYLISILYEINPTNKIYKVLVIRIEEKLKSNNILLYMLQAYENK